METRDTSGKGAEMSDELYPKGTIVRFTLGPLGIIKGGGVDYKFSPDVVWSGNEGIYVGLARQTSARGEEWHLVMVETGDVPVLASMIEAHPDHAEKNQALAEYDTYSEPEAQTPQGEPVRRKTMILKASELQAGDVLRVPGKTPGGDEITHAMKLRRVSPGTKNGKAMINLAPEEFARMVVTPDREFEVER